ncbi:MAG: hypothetical protein EON94_04495, partial [Caulobacteraceae bacterium]
MGGGHHLHVGVAARLDKISGAHVTEARDGDRLQVGHVYVAPGGDAH